METALVEEVVERLESNIMMMGNPTQGVDVPMEISTSDLEYIREKSVTVGEKSAKMFEILSDDKIRLHGPPVPVEMMGLRGYVYMEEEGYNGFLPITCIRSASEGTEWLIEVR